MSTATLPAPTNPSKPLLAKERLAYLRRFKALGWTQNEAARQIDKNEGLFSRWMRGKLSSAPMRLAIDARLTEAEHERLLAHPIAAMGGRA